MMKTAISMALVALALILAACSSPESKSQLKGETENYVSEGWLDDNTFQVKALGAPDPSAKGFVRRRTQAEEAALLAAQKRTIELLVGASIKGASGSDSGESTGIAITKEFEGVVKGGQVLRKTFDGEDNCEIVYRVQSKGLKKQAQTQASKNDFR